MALFMKNLIILTQSSEQQVQPPIKSRPTKAKRSRIFGRIKDLSFQGQFILLIVTLTTGVINCRKTEQNLLVKIAKLFQNFI